MFVKGASFSSHFEHHVHRRLSLRIYSFGEVLTVTDPLDVSNILKG
jgi:hypothetical protein